MAEERAFKGNFIDPNNAYIDLVRVTNVTNTIEAKRAFVALMEQQ